ncbi:MAG TPA: hypothetical protein VJA16_23430 [Thermoanaerobaculia bacterium]
MATRHGNQRDSSDDEAELWRAHQELSEVDLRFRQLARRDEELKRRATFPAVNAQTPYFQFRRQLWPTFAGRRWVRDFAAASVGVNDLVRSVPARIFGNDPAALARFYGIDEDQARLALTTPDGLAGAVGRADFVASRNGFWCVELNLTACLGGWETGLVAPMLLEVPALARFIAAEGLAVGYSNTVRLLLAHVVRHALAAGLAETAVNVAVLCPRAVAGSPYAPLLAREYAATLAGSEPAVTGTIGMCVLSDLAERGGRLWWGERRLHAVIQWILGPSDSAVVRCFKAGNLHLYNAPLGPLLSDKRTLALLSERAESSVFTAAERRIIREHIPWTRLLAAGETTFAGERVALADFVLARRHDLVLKKGQSAGGEAVIIGRFTAAADWRSAVAATLAAGDWIVQEYVESLPFLFQDGAAGCSPHDVVWGPFVFGDTYAGTILRLQPKTLGGIVNLSREATEGIILEVDDDPGAGEAVS